jgi:hypothetical protein
MFKGTPALPYFLSCAAFFPILFASPTLICFSSFSTKTKTTKVDRAWFAKLANDCDVFSRLRDALLAFERQMKSLSAAMESAHGMQRFSIGVQVWLCSFYNCVSHF